MLCSVDVAVIIFGKFSDFMSLKSYSHAHSSFYVLFLAPHLLNVYSSHPVRRPSHSMFAGFHLRDMMWMALLDVHTRGDDRDMQRKEPEDM